MAVATPAASATSLSVWAAGRWSVGIAVSPEGPLGGGGLGRVATLNRACRRTFVQSSFQSASCGEAAAPFRPVGARPCRAAMPLTLITGPANAAKAGAFLERLRAAVPRDPVLVVPTSADAGHYARELAGAGIVFGADVTTFGRLMRDIARAAGVPTRTIGRLARARVVRAAVADVSLSALRISAGAPGFADALGAFFAELERSL